MQLVTTYQERTLMFAKSPSNFSAQNIIKSYKVGWAPWQPTLQESSKTGSLIYSADSYPYERRDNVLSADWAGVSKWERTRRSRRTNIESMDEKTLCRCCNQGLNDISTRSEHKNKRVPLRVPVTTTCWWTFQGSYEWNLPWIRWKEVEAWNWMGFWK